jgi:hypothetical protein
MSKYFFQIFSNQRSTYELNNWLSSIYDYVKKLKIQTSFGFEFTLYPIEHFLCSIWKMYLYTQIAIKCKLIVHSPQQIVHL